MGSSAPRFYSLMRARNDVEELGKLPRIAGQPIRLTGYMDGKPLKPEAAFWRRVFLLFAAEEPPPDVLIVVRDTDGDLRRLEGLGQALDFLRTFPRPLPVVVAAPNQDAEAWFVAGFVPQDEPERRRLKERTEILSFNPSEEPHRLTARPNEAPTDAKRVLRILVFNEDQSRPPSVEELPDLCERTLHDLALLERRGERCGLSPFLRDLRATLVPC